MKQKYSPLLIFICGIFFIFPNLLPAQPDNSRSSGDTTTMSIPHKGFPVVPFSDTLFYVKNNIGSFTASERAEAIARRIRDFSKDPTNIVDSLKVLPVEDSYEVRYADVVILIVTPTDADQENLPAATLAESYRNKIVDSVRAYRRNIGWKNILTQIGLTLLIIAVLFLVIKYLNKFYLFLKRKIISLKGSKLKGISIKSYKILDADKEVSLLTFLLNLLRWAAIILLLYLSLPLIFSIFPATRPIAEKLFGYIANPIEKIFWGIVGYIPNLFTIIIVVVFFRYLVKGLRYAAKEISEGTIKLKGFYADWAMPTFTIIRVLLYVFMFIIIFPYLPGSGSDIFKGVSVFLGIIVSLGSTSLIGNVVSGLVLTYMRPFKPGDRVKIGQIEGNIIEKTPFVTRLRTPKNEEITIPNSNIMTAHTINYSNSARENGVIIHTILTMGYEVPWPEVHKLLIDSALKTTHVLNDPPPYVLQVALDDFYVQYQINAYIKEENQMPRIYSELHQNIQDVFAAAGLEVMSPHYYAERDGNSSTIPHPYLQGKTKSKESGTNI